MKNDKTEKAKREETKADKVIEEVAGFGPSKSQTLDKKPDLIQQFAQILQDAQRDVRKMEEVHICAHCKNAIDWHMNADGTPYWTTGHNGQPLVDGRVCDTCNDLVIAERISGFMKRRGV